MAKKKSEVKIDKTNDLAKEIISKDILPQNFIKMGEQVLYDKNIYILQDVYKSIHEFTEDKLTVESGGILMGYTIHANGKVNIVINGFIEGKYSEGTPTTLKFTHETWEYVHKEAEEHFPDDKIIGWIHTHPNFGIFLSNYDKFIQQNFFNDENQIAYVVDPIRHTEGFFFWVNEQIEKCSGFYIYDDIGVEIDIPENITDSVTTSSIIPQISSENNKKSKVFYIINLLCFIFNVFCLIVLSSNISDIHQSINVLNEQVLTQNQVTIENMRGIAQDTIDIKSNINKHTVAFLYDDGTLFSKSAYNTGELVLPPDSVPVKPDDEKYSYTFSNWDSDFEYVSGDMVYKAVFTKKLRDYTIRFENEKGEEISSDIYHFGDEVEIPKYVPHDLPNDGKVYNITWDKEVTSVSSDMTYRAVIVTADNENHSEKTENESSSKE